MDYRLDGKQPQWVDYWLARNDNPTIPIIGFEKNTQWLSSTPIVRIDENSHEVTKFPLTFEPEIHKEFIWNKEDYDNLLYKFKRVIPESPLDGYGKVSVLYLTFRVQSTLYKTLATNLNKFNNAI